MVIIHRVTKGLYRYYGTHDLHFIVFTTLVYGPNTNELRSWYIHRNPVKRGLVGQPDQWKWSSFRAYFFGERGPVRVNFQEWASEIKCRTPQKFGSGRVETNPLIRKKRE